VVKKEMRLVVHLALFSKSPRQLSWRNKHALYIAGLNLITRHFQPDNPEA
jgi:hypothetical protein